MTKNFILDTDIGCDCDDAGALYILNVFCDKGYANLKAVTHTTSQKHGIACVSAINRFFGRNDIPLGVLKESGFFDTPEFDTYGKKSAEKFPEGIICSDDAEDAIDTLRRTLAEADDNSLSLCFVGQLRNAANLLRSQPDCHSPLNGVDLVAAKVNEITVMGGDFRDSIISKTEFCEEDAEYNIKCDIESSKYFCDNCPVRVVFCGFELGCDIITGKKMLETFGNENPARFMYFAHGGERESWDLLAVLYAVFGAEDYFELSKAGKITVTDIGVTAFKACDGGKHFYLKHKLQANEMIDILENLLLELPKCKFNNQ